MDKIAWATAVLGLAANGFFASFSREYWGKDLGLGGAVLAWHILLAMACSLLFLIVGGLVSAIGKDRPFRQFLRQPPTVLVISNFLLNGLFIYGYFFLGTPGQ